MPPVHANAANTPCFLVGSRTTPTSLLDLLMYPSLPFRGFTFTSAFAAPSLVHGALPSSRQPLNVTWTFRIRFVPEASPVLVSLAHSTKKLISLFWFSPPPSSHFLIVTRRSE